MKLLLISNSTMHGEPYLGYPMPYIKKFLGKPSMRALFIPYAAVTFSFDEYEQKVQKKFEEIGQELISIHHFDNPRKAIERAQVIVVGGGNTWQLLRMVHDNKLTEVVQEKVLRQNIPYIGWSAGSNLACPTIKTTNDMPIIDPKGFNAFNLVPFQINPHYLDKKPEGHGGESREDRIKEFIEINRKIHVVGLREGSILQVENNTIQLFGKKPCRIFHYGKSPKEVGADNELGFLMEP